MSTLKKIEKLTDDVKLYKCTKCQTLTWFVHYDGDRLKIICSECGHMGTSEDVACNDFRKMLIRKDLFGEKS